MNKWGKELSRKQKLIAETELQTHLEDGWKGVGVLQNGQIVVEVDEAAHNKVRRIIKPIDLEAHLKEGWNIAAIRTALVLPSGRYIVEGTKSFANPQTAHH